MSLAHLCKAGHRKRRTRLGRHRRYPSRRRRPDRQRRFLKNETGNRRNKIIRLSDRQKLRRNLLLQIQKGKMSIYIKVNFFILNSKSYASGDNAA